MPVQMSQTSEPLTMDVIRMFLRDQPEKNPLLEDVEWSNAEINNAIDLAVARYNVMTPITNNVSVQLNSWMLLTGVCAILFRSEGARQLRNQVQAQDGGVAPVGMDEKESLYARWADWFAQEFERIARAVKMQANMEGGWGGLTSGGGGAYGQISSGYRWVGRWYRRL